MANPNQMHHQSGARASEADATAEIVFESDDEPPGELVDALPAAAAAW